MVFKLALNDTINGFGINGKNQKQKFVYMKLINKIIFKINIIRHYRNDNKYHKYSEMKQ